MFTYEVNLLCPHPHCDEIVCSDTEDTVMKGEANVIKKALRQNWQLIHNNNTNLTLQCPNH